MADRYRRPAGEPAAELGQTGVVEWFRLWMTPSLNRVP